MSENILYSNGQFLPLELGRVSVEDRGFQFGDGVYEVIRVLNGRALWWQEHLDRLATSLRAVRIQEALAEHDLPAVLEHLLELSALDEGLLYLQVTRGAGARDFFFPSASRPTVIAYARAAIFPGEEETMSGIAVHLVEDMRWARCDIKSVNLLAAVLAKQEAREAGCREALWTGEGRVREGASSNFFAVLRGVLRTHPADNHILNGITRQTVLRLSRQMGLVVEERAVSVEELAVAEELFVASTANHVMPVTALGGRPLAGGRPGPVTLALANAVRAEAAQLAGLDPPPSLPLS